MLSGLDDLPKSILFWRALTQWLGGLGILTFFLMVSFRAPSAVFKLYGAESHKIAAPRLKPGIFNTLKILWIIYLIFSLAQILILKMEGLSFFDSLTHTFTTLSTGGYSTHDASIDYFRQAGYRHYNLIEYTFSFFMLLGGISFLIHYQVLKGKFNSLWKGIEMKYFWGILFVSILLIMGNQIFIQRVESIGTTFKYTLFQVISIFTTTGYTTRNIASPFFTALAKQVFLILMVIGGCVGSTAGGVKVLRIAMLDRVVRWKTHQLKSPRRAVTPLLLEGRSISTEEIQGIVTLFASWIVLLIVGGLVTAFFTKLGPLESFSGMFSALGNIGPCYIKSFDMIHIHPIVKLTYIIGMLAGRLEILPVLLLFSPRAWR
jgi:trk system potassium uptake protein TrkH